MKPELDGAKFKAFASDCKDIIKAAEAGGVKLVSGDGETGKPKITDNEVVFNGYEDEAHETFYVERSGGTSYSSDDSGRVFHFCKTACKPYDAAVCACLISLKHHFGEDVKISSDGDEGDWEEGKQLYRDVTGREVTDALDREDD